jgi:hypothetical protein
MDDDVRALKALAFIRLVSVESEPERQRTPQHAQLLARLLGSQGEPVDFRCRVLTGLCQE